MTQPHDSPHHAKVHNAMKRLCARNGSCSPDEIAAEAGVPKRRVHERIKVLVDMGHAKQMGRGLYAVTGAGAVPAANTAPPAAAPAPKASPADDILRKIRAGRPRSGGNTAVRRLFGQNSQQRIPLILVLDISGSMNVDDAIGQLIRGLLAFIEDLLRDDLAAKRVQIAIVTFGGDGVRVAREFVDAESFRPPTISADGTTPMGKAILAAVQLMREQKRLYRDHGIASHTGWIFMVSDGEPKDDVSEATRVLHDEIARPKADREFNFYPVAVRQADRTRLEEISGAQVLELKNFAFTKMFLWVSDSLKRVSASLIGQRAKLGPTSPWSSA